MACPTRLGSGFKFSVRQYWRLAAGAQRMPSVGDSADDERKLIDAIYRGVCDSTEMTWAIELLGRYFGSSGVVVGELDRADPDSQFTIGVGTSDEVFLRDYVDFASIDPAPAKFATLPIGMATTSDRMFSPEFLRTYAFLHEYMRPHGVEATLAAPLLSAGGCFAIVGIHQGVDQRPFEDDDLARLERLAPHLARALQIRRLFLRNEKRSQALEAMLHRNRAGLIGLSTEPAPLFVNAAARLIAAAKDGVGIGRDGRLIVADRRAKRQLSEFEAQVRAGGAGGVVRVERPSGKPGYAVLVAPLPATNDIVLRARRGAVLFAIHDPDRRAVTTAQRITQLLCVPIGAAKVIEALLNGIDLKDYAEQEGISANTVKFHLKTAFNCTGVRRQTDLVRRALLALNDLES